MPAKSKKDKRKKKKGRLTNEEILKLIKKLKPKNQQTVRINIGDKGEKKVASNNQQPVKSEVSYFRAPPQTDFFQPPQPPFLINKPAPSLAETTAKSQIPLEPPIAPEFIPRKIKERKLKRIELQPEEYSYEDPFSIKQSFQEPSKFKQNILGAIASQPTYYYNPVQNDPYQPELIQTTQAQDQIGNRSSFNMSSDTWTLTPEGEIETVGEIQQAQQQQPQEPPTPEPVLTEEELIQQQADLLIESAQKESTRQEQFKNVRNIYESSSESGYQSREFAPNITIFDVNRLIREGQLDLQQFEIDPNVVFKTGKKKGQLRKEITSRELAPILQAVDKQGLTLKKTVSRTEA